MNDEVRALATFTGVITHVTGERGVVKHITYSKYGEPSGTLVRMDERPAFAYVSLGARALVCTCGADPLRREHHHPHCLLLSNLSSNYREVLGWREVDRDEFDNLTGIATLRSEFGWDLD